jgi:hypothetical protein
LAGLAPEVDIGIKQIGLRPGEKLHEDLFYAEEVPLASQVDGILTARSKTVPLELLRPEIAGLVSDAVRNDVASIHETLSDILHRFDGCRRAVAERAPEAETSSDHASPVSAAWPRAAPIIDGVSPEPVWRSAGSLG